MDKILSVGIPCFNSAEYMDTCIRSLLEGSGYAEDLEIIIVDDGSRKDGTPAKADAWQERYPSIIKAVHQENGGHGVAVMKALSHASGLYFKNVDSDDWVDERAFAALLGQLRSFASSGDMADLVITNFVYEHVEDGTQHRVTYHRKMPIGRMFGWDGIRRFNKSQYLLMHAITYRTEVVRAADLDMPPHTFYVDNIYAYVPFPKCEKLFYLDVDLYRYFIGRDDQSVNEKVLTDRIDHYWRVARVMMHAYHLYDEVESVLLRDYMMGYFTIIMAICSVFSRFSDREDAADQLDALWEELKAYDPHMYRRARHGLIGMATNLPGEFGTSIIRNVYRIVRRVVKFN